MKQVVFGNTTFYQITNIDKMRPFFMTILSSSNHWMFVSSNGGLTAGRISADFSLFPYYTEDKITDGAEYTGSKTIIRGKNKAGVYVWEPFSERNRSHFETQRNLYKSIYGNELIFEEINQTLGLIFRYQWSNAAQYGFIRKATLVNLNAENCQLDVLDGLQNILPAGVGSDLQNFYSNLVDAYKQSELAMPLGLGIYALSAIIVDRAEPSEALKANTVWSFGLQNPINLLSTFQLESFRNGRTIHPEIENKGEKGAYFICETLSLTANDVKEWYMVADVHKSHSEVIHLMEALKQPTRLIKDVLADVAEGTSNLLKLACNADGLQNTSDPLKDSRHFSNVLFNIMRGGIFDDQYLISKSDFLSYLNNANKHIFKLISEEAIKWPEKFDFNFITQLYLFDTNTDFQRLSKEYLPLYFSRRHGDPSRPWNKFYVNTINETDGSKVLDYQGNWRDIFQNWEALAMSFPEYAESMVYKFLNATTFEGYNPYRVSKDGFDWEIIEPDDPWAYIGYWGDHQVIYLLKFLEFITAYKPDLLGNLFDKESFVYAHVPYKIKKYQDIVLNPKDTITFDHVMDLRIREERTHVGSDACLVKDEDNNIHHVNFIEKILAVILSKISNFIPEAGIWMNTQRPEWNDANNALVGNGVSMVTLYYLRRFLVFFEKILCTSPVSEVKISQELIDCYKNIRKVLEDNVALLSSEITDSDRRNIMDQLGEAASSYRWHVYDHGFWGKKRTISIEGIQRFNKVSLQFIDHTIQSNKRPDGLYHAYNLASFEGQAVQVSRLTVMLEGQVAALSAGILDAKQVVQVLNALKQSPLYVEDRNSYILYPDKKLPGFLEKNTFDESEIKNCLLIQELIEKGNKSIIERDALGYYHFNKNFKNNNDLKDGLSNLISLHYVHYNEVELNKIYLIYEKIFNHKAFTGRSGTFYAYEGLGSVYWHMVSKLLLAVLENIFKAYQEKVAKKDFDALVQHYYDLYEGLGVHKSPQAYGAFPTDAYSHTPSRKGAQQPGMTGQVKEDIICHWGELGVQIQNGQLHFKPIILTKKTFKSDPFLFTYTDVKNKQNKYLIPENSMAFTYCQVPVIYELGDKISMTVTLKNQEEIVFNTSVLSAELSEAIFLRKGIVQSIKVFINPNALI